MKITNVGPKIFWKRHRMADMPLAYGGCYVTENLPDGVSPVDNIF